MIIDQERLIDARGHRCPVPTLRLQRAVAEAIDIKQFRLLADDPMARIDVPHFADQAGLSVVSIETNGAVTTFVLRRFSPKMPNGALLGGATRRQEEGSS